MKQKSFTLLELLIVIGIIAVLVAIAVLAINPARQFAKVNNARRTHDLKQIVSAIQQNMVDNRGPFSCSPLPAVEAIMRSPATSFEISDPAMPYYDICGCLVPTYLPVMPFDPSPQVGEGGYISCTDYNTEYTIQEVASLLLRAPYTQIIPGIQEGIITVTLPGQITVMPPSPDFTLSANPSSDSIVQGDSTSTTITATSYAGFSELVTFSPSINPSEPTISISFTPTNSCTPPPGSTCFSTMNVTTQATTPAETYTITITGTDGGLTRQTTFTLTVVSSPPAAPSNLTGSAFCAGSNDPDISLAWTDNSTNEEGFKLYRGTAAGFIPTDPPLATLAANTTSYTDTTPSPSTTYYYKIKAFNAGGDSTFASSPAITTDSCAPTFVLIPSSANILVGQTQQFDGEYDPDGPGGSALSSIVARAAVTWSSSDISIATINSTGLATGVAPGSVTITGVYSGITATANLTVSTQLWGSAICEAGTLNSWTFGNYAMGYRFTPNVNINVSQLCGRWPAAVAGARTIRIQNSAFIEQRNVSVNSSGGAWACASITSIILTAGSSYYVNEYGTGYYYQGTVTLPRTCNNVSITDTCYQLGASGGFTGARTCSSGASRYIYGQADIFFSP